LIFDGFVVGLHLAADLLYKLLVCYEFVAQLIAQHVARNKAKNWFPLYGIMLAKEEIRDKCTKH